jgi:N-methylhydantoinase A
VPIHGGVLSALGMVVANRGRQFSKTLKPGQQHDDSAIIAEFARLEKRAREELLQEGLLAAELVVKRSVDMRYLGQAYTLNLAWENLQQAQQAFSELHLKRYGYVHEVAIELVNLRATVLAPTPSFDLPRQGGSANGQIDGQVNGHATADACNKVPPDVVYSEQATVIERSAMPTGYSLLGPAVISEYSSTTYVALNWVARVDEFGNILLRRRT